MYTVKVEHRYCIDYYKIIIHARVFTIPRDVHNMLL